MLKFHYFIIGILIIYSRTIESFDIGNVLVALDEFDDEKPEKLAAASFKEKEEVNITHSNHEKLQFLYLIFLIKFIFYPNS